MSDLGSYLEKAVQEWWADGESFPAPPTNVYVGLHTADPGNDGSNNELDAADYERAETAAADWTVSSEAPTEVENVNEIQFPVAESNWGDVTHTSLWDAQDGGNCLWQGELVDDEGEPETRTITEDDRLVFLEGEYTADLD